MNDKPVTDVVTYMDQLGGRARAAARVLAAASTAQKNAALSAIATELDASRAALAEANAKDLEGGRAKGLDAALIDRLAVSPKVIDSMIEGVRQVAALPDPIGEVFGMNYRPSASRSAGCGCRSAWSASSTSRAPT